MKDTLTTFQGMYAEVERIRIPEDLEKRSLHISAAGGEWHDAPRLSDFPPAMLVKLYRDMVTTRATDREIVKFQRKGLVFGKHLTCTGNEASAVGATSAARPSDWVTMAVRDLGAFIVREIPIHQIFAQACGRAEGLTRGWDGSLHMGSRPAKIIGLVSHLGTLIPVATGCAFAEKYHGTDDAVLAFSGEGATSTGDFHEGLNIASVLRLPMVVVVENNQWAFGTPTRLQFAAPTLALRALAYGRGVEGLWVDGTNVLNVYDAVRRALMHARTKQIITIVETVSMRFEGHSLADPFNTYVPTDQLSSWKDKDPIALFRRRLASAGVATENELDEVDASVADMVNEAARLAEQSPPASGDDIEGRVFVPSTAPFGPLTDPPADGIRISYHQAIQDALREEMDRHEDLFIIGEDIGISDGAFKITAGFSKRYDQVDWGEHWQTNGSFLQRRVIDAPLAEAGFCGLALGALAGGLRAIVEFQYADFASEAFKMIVNYAATETVRGMGPLPIVFRMPSGWAPNTSIYHSVNPESWFGSTPGLKVVAPATAFDAKGLLKAALHDNNPVLFLEYKTLYRVRPEKTPLELNLPIPAEDYFVPIGKGRVVKEGRDLSVITYGSQLWRALDAVNRVENEDSVSIELIDLRSIVPFDAELIQASVRKTNRALVTCEAPRTGCFGNTIVTEIIRSSFDELDAPVRLVAAADTPVPFAPALEAAHLPTVDKLAVAIRELLSR